MTGSTAARRFMRRLMAGVTRRFCPVVKTRSLYMPGALWPRYPASARMRLRVAPVSASISGITVARVWPSYGRPGSALAWIANWPPLQRLRVVAMEALTPNS